MGRSFDRFMTNVKPRLAFLMLKAYQGFSHLYYSFSKLPAFKRIYLILSIDLERDLYVYKTGSKSGLQVGVPCILDIFAEHDIKGKACWLVEYNDRDRLAFCNPSSKLFVPNHEDYFEEIRRGGYEFGLHPAIYAFEQGQWNYETPLKDPLFVAKVIHEGSESLRKVCKKQPVGCRTSAFHFALSLPKALETEGYLLDCSHLKGLFDDIKAPNAWFTGEQDYRFEKASGTKTKVLEVPTTDYVQAAWNGLFSLEYKPFKVKGYQTSDIIFLSAFFHSWNAVTLLGKCNNKFKSALDNFLNSAMDDYKVNVVSFSEAHKVYEQSLKQQIAE